jgi:hypothetical protein
VYFYQAKFIGGVLKKRKLLVKEIAQTFKKQNLKPIKTKVFDAAYVRTFERFLFTLHL